METEEVMTKTKRRRGCATAAGMLAVLVGAAPLASVHAAEKPKATAHRIPSNADVGKLPEGIGIAPGEPAPDVVCNDVLGNEVHLKNKLTDGPLLLIFYRGGWCPYCNFQIRELTLAYPEFARRGITPIAISVDKIEASVRTQATYNIPFPVLSDSDLSAHEQFRVAHRVDSDQVARLKKFGMDLEAYSGADHHTIAIPSMFLIDKKGIVRWAHAETNHKLRPSPEQVFQAIDAVDIVKETR